MRMQRMNRLAHWAAHHAPLLLAYGLLALSVVALIVINLLRGT